MPQAASPQPNRTCAGLWRAIELRYEITGLRTGVTAVTTVTGGIVTRAIART
jgi:hypothetical protein